MATSLPAADAEALWLGAEPGARYRKEPWLRLSRLAATECSLALCTECELEMLPVLERVLDTPVFLPGGGMSS